MAEKSGGVIKMWNMLKELDSRSTIVLLVWKYSIVSFRIAKYCANIMSNAVDSRVTEKIKAQANIFIIYMNEGGDFFKLEVTD
jgi:hypothetical protein